MLPYKRYIKKTNQQSRNETGLDVLCHPCESVSAAGDPRLDPFPLGAAVLEPYLHLHLAQPQVVRDLRSLREAEVLFRVELLLQLEQLLTRERGPPAPRFPATAAAAYVAGTC